VSQAGPDTAVNATSRLAVALLPRLGGTGNVVFSPYSIEAALAMVDQGAAGQTAMQIGQVLGASDPAELAASNEQLGSGFAAAVRPPAGTSSAQTAQLDVANGLWLQSGFGVNRGFTTALSQDFGAGPQTIDFSANPDSARGAINAWVADRTAQLIDNLFPAGTITAQTKLVLANAVYLKAHWSTPFASSQTAAAPFHPPSGPSVTVAFMHLAPGGVDEFPYARGHGYVAIALPYANSSLSLLAIMPTPGTLPAFQRALTGATIANIARSLSTRPVAVSMPKLTISIQTALNGVLSGLGMPLAFSNAADFRKISTRTRLQIQVVEHAAVIKVDEAGTVAAAATGVSIAPTAIAVTPSVPLTLNHPFLLFLRDDRTGAILFAARVTNPLDS
jgi:serpin B